MTERDDFLREHLSPPADSYDQPSGRPPETPPPAEEDDTPPRIALDDPIKQWIPGFGTTRVLRPGATSLDDTQALDRDGATVYTTQQPAGLELGQVLADALGADSETPC